MAITQYNVRQKRDRLAREITHFTAQAAKFLGDCSPQGKRCFTRAKRCLSHRLADLEKVELLLA